MTSHPTESPQEELPPEIKCPRCGCRLVTAEVAAALTGGSLRTVQRHLGAGKFPGALRERVPGNRFRWLIPLDEVEDVMAALMPPILEDVISEADVARHAARREIESERLGHLEDAQDAGRETTEALMRTLEHSAEFNRVFKRVHGWKINQDSNSLILTLQYVAMELRAGLYARSASEQAEAMDRLIEHATEAIALCRTWPVERG